MADPQRLAELRQQRALIAEHLAWLDRQIAAVAAVGTPQAKPTATAAPAPRAFTPSAPRPPAPETTPISRAALISGPAAGAGEAVADTVLQEWVEQNEERSAPPSKFGCWTLFAAGLLLFAAGSIFVIYRVYG